MTAPTPDEVACATVVRVMEAAADRNAGALVVGRVTAGQLATALRALLAALDAAERERERLRVALGGYHDSDLVSLATTLRARDKVAETAEARVAELERERDEANARLDVARGCLHTALRERDEAYLRLDAERALSRKEPS